MKHKKQKLRSKATAYLFLPITLLATVFINPAGAAEEWTAVDSNGGGLSLEEKLQQEVSLDYKDTDIVNVLRSFAWSQKLNIVTGPEVQGKVTISLKDITAENALEAILTINGLVYNIRDNVIYVSPGDPEVVGLENEVIFLKYTKAANAQNILRKLLSEKSDIKIDEVQNILIITDFPENIKKVMGVLKKIDVAPQQVLIEAKIVDITSTDLNALGVTWNVEYDPTSTLTKTSHLLDNLFQLQDLDATVSMPEQSSGLSGGQIVLSAFNLKGLELTATIDALVKDGKANLLASPSIAVLNGQEARIIIGERFPIKERTQTTTGTTETTRFVDIGTTLKVTPQINEDGYITMRVHPEVSSLAASLDAGPRITTREADTTVRIKEGETLVIGGLIKQKDDSSKEKVPVLGNIPFIGNLFSRSERDKEQKELAVFITPKISRSQEEKKMLSKKRVAEEEVYVNILNTGELNLVAEIFSKAKALDKGYGVESIRKSRDARKSQAANLYEHIYSQYPDNVKTPEALYQAAMIHYHYFKDHKKAGELLSYLISDYPASPFAGKARKIHKKLSLASKKIKQPKHMDLKILTEE